MAIRVLVVDDSLTMRQHIIEVLSRDPDILVVGEARDGKGAIEACERLRPDIVTLDIVLPIMSGVAATEYIMAYFPTPILIVSAAEARGDLFHTYEALAAGAIDVLDKSATEPAEDWNRKLLERVKLASRIKVITHPRARLAQLHGARARALLPTQRPGARLVVIGGSTGAPGAVVEILGSLPPSFPAPILLVIHLSEPFAPAFAEWLDGLSPLRVAYAQDREALPSRGVVRMAPPGSHLVLQNGRLRLTREPPRNFCRPSVDALLDSVAQEAGSDCIACLLTGMGRDGAQGMLSVRRAGGRTIAQDEATSVVFGMPREAIALGGAERVLPLGEIGPALTDAVAGGKGES